MITDWKTYSMRRDMCPPGWKDDLGTRRYFEIVMVNKDGQEIGRGYNIVQCLEDKTRRKDRTMEKGQRVEIINGDIKGQKATVTTNPGTGKHEVNGEVWIKFDNEHTPYGQEKAMIEQWFEIKRLRPIPE